jgi:hypothetical protein
MLSQAAPPHAPVDGRTASYNPLNGAQCRILTAQSWMGGRSGARNDVLTPSVCSGRGYTSLPGGWIKRLYGECRLRCKGP